MPTQDLVLTEDQNHLIQSLVSSGRYPNASEVVREGLRLVEQRAAEDAARLASLCEAVEVGWRDLNAGRYRDVREADIADYVAQLGALASQQARSEG